MKKCAIKYDIFFNSIWRESTYRLKNEMLKIVTMGLRNDVDNILLSSIEYRFPCKIDNKRFRGIYDIVEKSI